MNKGWERQFWTEFLELYKNLPALWRVGSADYCNRALKADAYDLMAQKLREIDPSADRDSVKRKINSFRCSYRRDLNKKKLSRRCNPGGEKIFQSTLWYFDFLNFLEDQEDTLEGSFGMDVVEEETEMVLPSSSKSEPMERKRIVKKEDKLIQLTAEHLREKNYDALNLAKGWASQYAELPSRQKIFVRKLFSDVLFAGCLDKLDESVVYGVQNLLESADRTVEFTPMSVKEES